VSKAATASRVREVDLPIEWLPRQRMARDTEAMEVLYGGAAGGGKSFFLRAILILACSHIPGFQGFLFRRKTQDLKKNHLDGPTGFRALLSRWERAGFCTVIEKEIRFWNGSKIHLCHCLYDKDKENYQGAEMHMLCIDEATHFTESIYTFLRGRVRAPGLKEVPEEWAHLCNKIYLSANPGGIGHSWVKRYFVDPGPPTTIWRTKKEEGFMLRQFIPAVMQDNPFLMKDDPNYKYKLRGMYSKALAEAMEYGNWEIVAGGFFEGDFSDLNVVEKFKIPDHWVKFFVLDWGSSAPFSAGWYAVSSGTDDGGRVLEITVGKEQKQKIPIPSGALVRYREWYGAKAPEKGLKLSTKNLARGIKLRELSGEKIEYRVGGRDMWIGRGGPPIVEDFAKEKLFFQRADNERIPGWQQVRARLAGDDGRPALYFFEDNKDLLRVLPEAQHNENNQEDILLVEDHPLEELRYACMSRPWSREGPPRAEHAPKPVTFQEVLTTHFATLSRRRGRR
jgi:hypothetical protein